MSIDYSQASPHNQLSPDDRDPLISKWIIIAGAVGVVLVIGLFIGLMVWLSANYDVQIEAVRDIFIIVFAATACASVFVLIMLLVAVIRLINMLEFEIKPILEKTNETIGLVRGTTTFVSSNVVKPSIEVSSRVAGVRRGLKVLFGNPRRNLPD